MLTHDELRIAAHAAEVDVLATADTFTLANHLGYYCLPCERIHVLPKNIMNRLLAQMGSLPKGTRETKKLRREFEMVNINEHCYSLITAHPKWEPVGKLLVKQEESLAGFAEYCCAYIFGKEQGTPVRVFCATHEEGHLVPAREIKALRKEMSFKEMSLFKASDNPKFLVHAAIRALSAKGSNLLYSQHLSKHSPKNIATVIKAAEAARKTSGASTATELDNVGERTRKQHPLLTADPNYPTLSYILPPALLSKEMLVEFYVCGRKKAFPDAESARKKMKRVGAQPGNSVYLCSFCKRYHYGHTALKQPTLDEYAAKGLGWYRRFPEKANSYIHRILTEDESAAAVAS